MKAIFNGTINIEGIEIPVKLYPVDKRASNNFKLVCAEHLLPIHYKKVCETGHEATDITKAIIDNGTYIPIDTELLKVENDKVIDVLGFINPSSISPILLDKSYYITPQKEGIRAYTLLLKSLSITHKCAVVHFTIRNDERYGIITSLKNALLLTKLTYIDEIHEIPTIDRTETNQKDISTMISVINEMKIDFDMDIIDNPNTLRIEKCISVAKKSNKKLQPNILPLNVIESIHKRRAKKSKKTIEG